ncbi:Uncharacterised protein [Slackia heliotrinireducens]|nr:Uncharacterised protein [Slackia heliotrinireducens]
MKQCHARRGVAHHALNANLILSPLTMDRAILAVSLVAERTCLGASGRRFHGRAAFRAQAIAIALNVPMVPIAIDSADGAKRAPISVFSLFHKADCSKPQSLFPIAFASADDAKPPS